MSAEIADAVLDANYEGPHATDAEYFAPGVEPVAGGGAGCRVMRGGRPIADAIAVSKRTNVERKRFTLAHELAHRIIQSTGNPAIKLEAAMNRFAGAFLVPGQHLREEAGANRHRVTSGLVEERLDPLRVPVVAMEIPIEGRLAGIEDKTA